MISKGDDFPIHQLPAPVAEVGTERNFYDRYFFNGYSEDGSIFFPHFDRLLRAIKTRHEDIARLPSWTSSAHTIPPETTFNTCPLVPSEVGKFK